MTTHKPKPKRKSITPAVVLFLCLLPHKITTFSRTSEKVFEIKHFISLVKMWIFEKFNKEKNVEKSKIGS